MIAVLALAVAVLVGVGVELLLGRSLFRAILGLSLFAHAANLVVMAAGGAGAAAPILRGGDAAATADPLPQALVLTAIVISMAVTLYLVGLLRASAGGLGSVAVEPALAGDEGRDPEAVAAELRPGEEAS